MIKRPVPASSVLAAPSLWMLVLAASALLCSSCAPAGRPPIAAAQPEIADLVRRIDQIGQQFVSVRGLARVALARGSDQKTVSQVVIARAPDQLRLETLGLFGSPALLAATDGATLVVLLPGEGKAYAGSPDAGFLEKISSLPMTAEDVVSLLLLRPVLLAPQSIQLQRLDSGSHRLLLEAGELEQELDFDPDLRLNRFSVRLSGRLISSIRYERYRDGYPHLIELLLEPSATRVALEFKDVEVNARIDPGLFTIEPPPGYDIEPFPLY